MELERLEDGAMKEKASGGVGEGSLEGSKDMHPKDQVRFLRLPYRL